MPEEKKSNTKLLLILLAVLVALSVASASYFAWSYYSLKNQKNITVKDSLNISNDSSADTNADANKEDTGIPTDAKPKEDFSSRVIDGEEIVAQEQGTNADEVQKEQDPESLQWQAYSEKKFMNFSISFPTIINGGITSVSSGPRSEEESYWAFCQKDSCAKFSVSQGVGFRVLKMDEGQDLDSFVNTLEKGYNSKDVVMLAGQNAIKIQKTRGTAVVTEYYIEKDGYVLDIWKSLVSDGMMQRIINSLVFN